MLSAALKHLGLDETVRHLAWHEENNSRDFILLKALIAELYHKLDAMIRQLQVATSSDGDAQRSRRLRTLSV